MGSDDLRARAEEIAFRWFGDQDHGKQVASEIETALRAVEREARNDALEEAAAVAQCETRASMWVAGRIATAIRKLVTS